MKKFKHITISVVLIFLLSLCLVSCDGNIKHSKSITIASYFDRDKTFEIVNFHFYNIAVGYGNRIVFDKVDERALYKHLQDSYENYTIEQNNKIIYITTAREGDLGYTYGIYDGHTLFNGGIKIESEDYGSTTIFVPFILMAEAEKIIENEFSFKTESKVLLNVDMVEYLAYLNSFSQINLTKTEDNCYNVTETKSNFNDKIIVSKYKMQFWIIDNQTYVSYTLILIACNFNYDVYTASTPASR